MKLAIVAVVLAMVIFAAGLLIGMRLNGGASDAVSNSMLQEKIDRESLRIAEKVDRVDSKIDMLLNIATNAVRDLRR